MLIAPAPPMTDRLLTIAAWAFLAFAAGYLLGHLVIYVVT